ncbi:hypothetical protein PhaeoP51_03524 [Phaeobacter inhibens]|nr:hypothetical protein PhaeoP51_03524 [Phaeobacter inhibens]
MIFIWLGKVMSYLMLAGSMFKITFGFYFAITAQDHVAAAQRYLGASTTGEAINQGFLGLLVAVALGLLAQIASGVADLSMVYDEDGPE